MTNPSSAWHVGQAVHRPAAFLLGEKLDGKVQELRISDLTRSLDVAQVTWADGTHTEEPVRDLAAGAFPTRERGWLQRVRAMLAK